MSLFSSSKIPLPSLRSSFHTPHCIAFAWHLQKAFPFVLPLLSLRLSSFPSHRLHAPHLLIISPTISIHLSISIPAFSASSIMSRRRSISISFSSSKKGAAYLASWIDPVPGVSSLLFSPLLSSSILSVHARSMYTSICVRLGSGKSGDRTSTLMVNYVCTVHRQSLVSDVR